VSGQIRILVADDQRVVREGLVMLSACCRGWRWSGPPPTASRRWRWPPSWGPTSSSWDLRMPRLDGVQATRRLRDLDPEVVVIALTTYADDRSVVEALRAGARGYLTKDAGADEIRQAVEAVVRGEVALDPAVQRQLVDALAGGAAATGAAAPALPDGLTPREAEVLTPIADGLSNAEIAGRLVVSEATVKSHVNHLFAKIGARDRAQAVAYAYRNHLAP